MASTIWDETYAGRVPAYTTFSLERYGTDGQLATRLPDWLAGGLLRCSAARFSVNQSFMQCLGQMSFLSNVIVQTHTHTTNQLLYLASSTDPHYIYTQKNELN